MMATSVGPCTYCSPISMGSSFEGVTKRQAGYSTKKCYISSECHGIESLSNCLGFGRGLSSKLSLIHREKFVMETEKPRFVSQKFKSGDKAAILAASSAPEVIEDYSSDRQTHHRVRIHYNRRDLSYEGWGLHVWGDTDCPTAWENPLQPVGMDDFGPYWEVDAVKDGDVFVMIHDGSGRREIEHRLQVGPDEGMWIVAEHPSAFSEKPEFGSIRRGSIKLARAMWVAKDLIAWILPSGVGQGASYFLHGSEKARLVVTGNGVEGATTSIPLEVDVAGLSDSILRKFPHFVNSTALRLPPGVDAKALIKCQLAVSSRDNSDLPLNAAGVQLPGVLDDVYAYDGPLGLLSTEGKVTLNVWAPTAQNVRLLLFSEPEHGEQCEALQMEEREHGVWTAQGPVLWMEKYFLYEVTAFHPSSGKIEVCLAPDPYGKFVSANGRRSLILDIRDPRHEPEGWKELANEKPPLKSFTDITIYELHVRDFSISDETVDSSLRGSFLAFTQEGSAGWKHLKALAQAGLTHVHLLPCYDFASVDEKRENWKSVDFAKLSQLPSDSEDQQSAIVAIQDEDGFNWGYDPVNWGIPDGSYASDPTGPARTLEFRKMVQSLNRMGLRVVVDVVYNHLYQSGPDGAYSVLDKIVPGYYVRRSADGEVENSACMNNTASEHYMLDRLIVDDLLHWARTYKVDGFRFDLMGHLMKSTMLRAKEALRSLTVERDGVDGSRIYIYGEGWNFGEVANNQRGVNATQANLAGCGIGSFNDRLRDAAIGGSPFGDPRLQGFLTGLKLQPNEFEQYQAKDSVETMKRLGLNSDWIQLGLAGNLSSFLFTNHEGRMLRGAEVLTHDGIPVAYASSPEETINYVSAHDNETLHDIIMLKSARASSLDDRCRINHMAISVVALAQGIPFLHAGDDTLRSKSLDRDSYNSGDWFNRLDWTYKSNNFGVGLPPKTKNGEKWPIMSKLLADASLKCRETHIMAAVHNLRELLRIRFSSPLFRLQTACDIQERLEFHNAGQAETEGVILMSLTDGDKDQPGLPFLDPLYRRVVVVFNARPEDVSIPIPSFQSASLTLHPVQMASHDKKVPTSAFLSESGTFQVPTRTTAVFVETR